MCGIYFTTNREIENDTAELIANRGPDKQTLLETNSYITYASILQVRDVYNEDDNNRFKILFNGELYNDEKSDTHFLYNVVKNCLDELCDVCDCCNRAEVYSLTDNSFKNKEFSRIKYCFCFVRLLLGKFNFEYKAAFLILVNDDVYFFKDPLGRKSLGFTVQKHIKNDIEASLFDNDQLVVTVSSVNFEQECSPHHIYKFNLQTKTLSREEYKTLQSQTKNYYTNFYATSIKCIDENRDTNLNDYVNNVYLLLNYAVKKRLHNYNNVILFSGGIDSLLLTIILHKQLEITLPIYLINTMFTNKKDSVDRVTGLQSYKKLQNLFKLRKFIFIDNNINEEDVLRYKNHIQKLIYPKKSLMDFNIGACLFFGAKKAREFGKVVFVGCGADELFCGYNNHKTVYDIKDRIKNDIDSLWKRNLGRDDRVISDNGVEARYPFIDTQLIDDVFLLPNELLITNFDGVINNKVILRLILKREGFVEESCYKKTAMQFGSGISKYEKNKLKPEF